MNISKYIESDHEVNIIQDLVSFDNENTHECTKLVSDFHNHIINWWVNVYSCEWIMNDHIHDLEKLWILNDILIYDDFVSVSCQCDDVQVIRSEIFHESTFDCNKTVWKIVLSWFMRMCKDEETFNNEKLDKWSNLMMIHANQTMMFLTFFKLVNCFESISYKFSSSTQLILISSISQVLICQMS